MSYKGSDSPLSTFTCFIGKPPREPEIVSLSLLPSEKDVGAPPNPSFSEIASQFTRQTSFLGTACLFLLLVG